jgi:hypothetical protein
MVLGQWFFITELLWLDCVFGIESVLLPEWVGLEVSVMELVIWVKV